MESENGVVMEDEKHVIGETTKESIHKEIEENLKGEIQPKNEVSQSIVEIDGNNSAVSKISKHAKVPYKMHHDYITARNRLDRAVTVANPYTCYNRLFFNKHLMIVYTIWINNLFNAYKAFIIYGFIYKLFL
jgi:hypothetical protein